MCLKYTHTEEEVKKNNIEDSHETTQKSLNAFSNPHRTQSKSISGDSLALITRTRFCATSHRHRFPSGRFSQQFFFSFVCFIRTRTPPKKIRQTTHIHFLSCACDCVQKCVLLAPGWPKLPHSSVFTSHPPANFVRVPSFI